MSDYFYLGASLPMLHFHLGQPPMSHAEFFETCRRLTNPADFERIRSAKLNASDTVVDRHGVLGKWRDAEFGLRNELVRVRARKKNVSPDPYLRSGFLDPSWAGRIREVIEELSPLRAEMHLLRLLWGVLDDLETGHLFDLDFLIVYSLKLQVLQRKASFDAPRGKVRLESIMRGASHHGI